MGLFVSVISMFLGIVPIAEIFDGSKLAFAVWVAFSFSIPSAITTAIMNKRRIKNASKSFLKKTDLYINGATVVGIDLIRNSFLYIEDDFLDSNREPIIIDYPMIPSGFDVESILGKRILVMYDSATTYQLMQVNEEISRMN